jgi:CubicO group peptidase (beta-lactamase class C family)
MRILSVVCIAMLSIGCSEKAAPGPASDVGPDAADLNPSDMPGAADVSIDLHDTETDVGLDLPDVRPSDPTAVLDEIMLGVLNDYDIPGGALALTFRGKLIYARGYGLANRDDGTAVTPRSLFRIASLSKSLTATAVLKLAEDGFIDLDQSAFSYLGNLPAPAGSSPDPRLGDITVRHLLQHSSGFHFPSYPSGDPLTETPEGMQTVADAMGVAAPVSPDVLVQYARGYVALDFDPGTRNGYSNLNFVILGRIIEAVSGMSYESYVRTAVLEPIGATNMVVGDTLTPQPGEVSYYDRPGADTTTSVYTQDSGVPWPYGGWDLAAMDGAAGWVGDVVDYSRLVLAIDGATSYTDVLSSNSIDQMQARPSYVPDDASSWYGLGIGIYAFDSGEFLLQHNGDLQGTATRFMRSPSALTLVVFFNSHPTYFDGPPVPGFGDFITDLNNAFFENRADFPTEDLFDSL